MAVGNRSMMLHAGARISAHADEWAAGGMIAIGVLSRDDGTPRILTCRHVLAPRPAIGRGVAVYAGGIRIGTVTAASLRLDAAVVRPNRETRIAVGVVDGHHVTGLLDLRRPASGGRAVWRLNRDGARVPGVLEQPRSPGAVEVDLRDGFPPLRFHSALRYRTSNTRGDSGAAVIDAETGRLVGMHFSGDRRETGLLMPARPIFRALGIRLP